MENSCASAVKVIRLLILKTSTWNKIPSDDGALICKNLRDATTTYVQVGPTDRLITYGLPLEAKEDVQCV